MPRNNRIANIPKHKCETCGQTFRRYINRARTVPRFCGMGCVNYDAPRHNVPLAERFWPRVQRTETCWLWTGSRSKGGYGLMRRAQKTYGAHVAAYELTYGPLKKGLHVLHRCDNPPCVRPDHLFAGTHRDNMQDMIRKGRKSGKGRQVLTEAQVKEIRTLYMAGDTSFSKLASAFGVGVSAINHIIHRRTWSHV